MTSSTFNGPTIVLHRPQIPQNTGNISRLCVALMSPLVITGKPAFRLDEASVRRAGLDHWNHLDFTHYPRFADFWRARQGRRVVCVTKSGRTPVFDFAFHEGDMLLFGNETMGLPPAMLRQIHHSVYLPMSGPVRSLNLSNSVAVVAYEYVRSIHGDKARHDHDSYPRTYYRRTSSG